MLRSIRSAPMRAGFPVEYRAVREEVEIRLVQRDVAARLEQAGRRIRLDLVGIQPAILPTFRGHRPVGLSAIVVRHETTELDSRAIAEHR
jgi:hypothetical protein